MPATLKDLTTAGQDNLLSAVEMSQTYVLESAKTWAATMGRVMPEMPAVPGIAELPSPAEAVTAGFELADKLLASQKAFAEELVSILTPSSAPAPKAAKSS
jgi:hypothetical protein